MALLDVSFQMISPVLRHVSKLRWLLDVFRSVWRDGAQVYYRESIWEPLVHGDLDAVLVVDVRMEMVEFLDVLFGQPLPGGYIGVHRVGDLRAGLEKALEHGSTARSQVTH